MTVINGWLMIVTIGYHLLTFVNQLLIKQSYVDLTFVILVYLGPYKTMAAA